MQLRFSSSDARDYFLSLLQREDPYLFDHMRPLVSQTSVVVVDDVESSARTRLKEFLASQPGPAVKIYDDVQFEVFGHVA